MLIISLERGVTNLVFCAQSAITVYQGELKEEMQTQIIALYHYVCGFLCPWQSESLTCTALFDLVHAVHTKTRQAPTSLCKFWLGRTAWKTIFHHAMLSLGSDLSQTQTCLPSNEEKSTFETNCNMFRKVSVFSVFSNISGAVLGASWPTLCIYTLQQKYKPCFELPKNLAPTLHKRSAIQKPMLEQCNVVRLTHVAPKTLNEAIPDWKTNKPQNMSRNIYDHIFSLNFCTFVSWRFRCTKYAQIVQVNWFANPWPLLLQSSTPASWPQVYHSVLMDQSLFTWVGDAPGSALGRWSWNGRETVTSSWALRCCRRCIRDLFNFIIKIMGIVWALCNRHWLQQLLQTGYVPFHWWWYCLVHASMCVCVCVCSRV